VKYALGHGYHTVLEGILSAERYGGMLQRLSGTCSAHFFYFDLSFEETVRRHATRPQSSEFGPDRMREWYRPTDLLPFVQEHVFEESSSLRDVVEVIVDVCRLEDVGSPSGLPDGGHG